MPLVFLFWATDILQNDDHILFIFFSIHLSNDDYNENPLEDTHIVKTNTTTFSDITIY